MAFGWSGRKKEKIKGVEGIAKIAIRKNETLLLLPEPYEKLQWEVIEEKPVACQSPVFHSSGEAQIGIPKQF